MTWGMTAVAGGSVVSGLIGGSAAKSAAKQQAKAIRQAAQIQERMFQQGRADLAPYRETGYTALEDIEAMRPFLTAQFGEDQFAQYLDPSMAFRQKLGTQATERLANVGGGAISGNTLRALQEFGQNLASTEYGNAFNRFQTERGNIYNTLANIAGMGQGAVNTGVTAGQQTAQNLGTLAVGQGQAQAAGTIGMANALGGTAQNLGNMYYLNQLMNRPVTQPVAMGAPQAGMPVPLNANVA